MGVTEEYKKKDDNLDLQEGKEEGRMEDSEVRMSLGGRGGEEEEEENRKIVKE